MDIGRSNKNFKDEKLKCFNCNKYGHMTKKCQAKKNEKTGHVSNVIKKNILPETAKKSR